MFQQALDTISKQVLIRPSYGNFIGGKFVAPVEGRYFEIQARSPARSCVRSRVRPPPTSSSRSTPPTRQRTPGARRRSPSDPFSSTRSPTRWRLTSICWRSSKRSTTASRSARRPTPTCRYASTIGAITPASCARRKAAFRRSTRTPSPIISMSRSASSARSFPGTSRC